MTKYICQGCEEELTTVLHCMRTIHEMQDEISLETGEIISEEELLPREDEFYECPECGEELSGDTLEEVKEHLLNQTKF